MPEQQIDWHVFDDTENLSAKPSRELERMAARCFQGTDGENLLAHFRAITLGRALGPGASDAVLRHIEGQRQLVAYLSALVERGRVSGS
ncbi:MAG: hypothetical protein HOA30_04375 [Rhodospirillaceae bacterium]|jgi:hypothetical protein|nr:hypothetical protein [Rhodospirillaceae bacterium]MBT3908602.1 hypothetical protein [Rhodospirillaceae bacterium]MBT5298436.1 hypothetical protein [Rhodospirillaceae bacterium]MBT5514931.1 hypothetical protein [Rhodospirillaceae bacterium]MBT6086912.1 hypothetical protein [Rhodospirillaceae bacterium]